MRPSLPKPSKRISFRRAVLRGLGVLLPPLLTFVILVWLFSTFQQYVLNPLENAATFVITRVIDDTQPPPVPASAERLTPNADRAERYRDDGRVYVQLPDDYWIPETVYERVQHDPGEEAPQTSRNFYRRYVELTWLKRYLVLPLFLMVFVSLLSFLGRFLAYGIGRVFYNSMEAIIRQVPFIRTVYTSVKQVTDFVFTENETEFTRVVAVEYPRMGIWSLGFVTGDGMRSMAEAAREPVVTVLIPTSPMPATGYTIAIRRSEVVDLDISVDQAIQFIVSCGVVVPLPQQYRAVAGEIQMAINKHLAAQDDSTTFGDSTVGAE